MGRPREPSRQKLEWRRCRDRRSTRDRSSGGTRCGSRSRSVSRRSGPPGNGSAPGSAAALDREIVRFRTNVRSYGFVLIAVSMCVAVADWIAVARRNRRGEYVLKPLTLAVLVTAAAFLKPGQPALRWSLTLIALGLSLGGDVFLMVPRDLFV